MTTPLYVAVVPTDEPLAVPTAVRPAVAAPVHCARLGDRTVVWSTAEREVGRGARTAEGLLLVTQVGRAFQDAHPEVTPLLDHGRHLVVDGTDPAALADPDGLCWRVQPLPEDAVVVDVPEVPARRRDAATYGLLAQLSASSYQADVTHLVGLGTRHSLSAGFVAAATWAADRMSALGYATTRPSISVGAGTSQNVIGERPGAGSSPRGVVVVCAHLDSVNLAGGPAAPAPGADDNASGSAAVLELGRVLATRPWLHDLRLILFGGEEQGLFGSKQYVAGLPPAERARIRAVLNMDMVASRNTPTPGVLLEGAAVSQAMIDDLAASAATYTGLSVATSLSPFASDHVPFIQAGLPALLTIEGNDSANGNIHSDRDVTAHLDYGLAMEILRMNLAALASWLGVVSAAVPRPAGPVVSTAPGRLDVFVVGADSGVYHKGWDGSGWQPNYDGLGGPVLRSPGG